MAKATWTDTRVECFSDPPGVDCGGDIEIFENTDDRDERYEFLAGFADQAPMAATTSGGWPTPSSGSALS